MGEVGFEPRKYGSVLLHYFASRRVAAEIGSCGMWLSSFCFSFLTKLKLSLKLLRLPTSYALHQANYKVLDSLSCLMMMYPFSRTSWVSFNAVNL